MNIRLFKRLVKQVRITTLRSGWKKAAYLKKHNVFAEMGDGCYYHPSTLPAEPFLLKLGNNVCVSSGVRFMTHGGAHVVFNGEDNTKKYLFRFGEIKIEDNVYIGADVKIQYGVTIGSRSIIAAGAVVTKDVPSGTVVAGIPAKVIGSYEESKRKALEYSQQFGDIGNDRTVEHLKQILDERDAR